MIRHSVVLPEPYGPSHRQQFAVGDRQIDAIEAANAPNSSRYF